MLFCKTNLSLFADMIVSYASIKNTTLKKANKMPMLQNNVSIFQIWVGCSKTILMPCNDRITKNTPSIVIPKNEIRFELPLFIEWILWISKLLQHSSNHIIIYLLLSNNWVDWLGDRIHRFREDISINYQEELPTAYVQTLCVVTI